MAFRASIVRFSKLNEAIKPPPFEPPPFRVGGKQVFLPNFVVTLIRTPKLPATFASFIVPLNLNKFDMRDYLFHVYNVRVTAVRSYIQHSKVRQDKPGAIKPKPRRWYRPRARKLMTVELERPFVWPREPSNTKPWEKDMYNQNKEFSEKQQEELDSRQQKLMPAKDRVSIALQAKSILRGEDQWQPREDYPDRRITWNEKDYKEPVEVETDVVLPKDSTWFGGEIGRDV